MPGWAAPANENLRAQFSTTQSDQHTQEFVIGDFVPRTVLRFKRLIEFCQCHLKPPTVRFTRSAVK
jgi:hypothetical protein